MKRFSDDINYIDAKWLVTEDKKEDEVENLFLTLGIIFNDLVGLIYFEKLLIETYEKPKIEEVTGHAGTYAGIIIQINKLFAGTVNEFFALLKEKNDLFNAGEFKEILGLLSKKDQRLWHSLIAAAHRDFIDVEDLLKAIVQIRHNLAFHFDNSSKILRKGYISYFFGKTKDKRNERAFYSLGDTIETTRFYFSDAAAEETIKLFAGKMPKENSIEDLSFKKYLSQIRETINVIATIISSLMKHYIQSRRNRPHKDFTVV